MATIKTRVTVKHTLPSGTIITVAEDKNLDYNLKLTKNIALWEVANKQAADSVKMILNEDVEKFYRMVQELRETLGVAFNFNSGYRTISFNKKCGGSSNSLHLKALAVDVSFPKISDSFYKKLESAWKKICEKYGEIGGCNHYTNGVHISIHEELFGYKAFVTRNYKGQKGDW